MEEKTKRKMKQVDVKIINANEESAVVEFTLGGLLQRAIIPTAMIVDGKAPDEVLIAGIPYGTPWEFLKLSANPIMLANTLRANGIWTYEDAKRKPREIVSALQAVYGVDLAALLEFARENK